MYHVKQVGKIMKKKKIINQKYQFYGKDKQLIKP
jgi:hypothetical protein